MPTNLSYFFPGLVGAVAPEVLRLYNLRNSSVSFQNWYFIVSALYALLGGYVATIAPFVNSTWLAFAVGVALPLVINFALKVVDGLTGGSGAGPGGILLPTDEGAAPAGTRGPAPQPAPEGAMPGTFKDFIRAL